MIEILPLASGSRGNCYHITDGRTPLLLECGIPFREIQKGLQFRVSGVAGCLVSHEHKDHSKAVQDVMKAGVDCYMSEGTRTALGVSGHRIHVIQTREQFSVGTWAVLPFDTVHDAEEPVGFLLANSAGDKLLYLTDTMYCRYGFNGLTHIMVECNYSLDILRENVRNGIIDAEMKNRIIRSHFGLENVKGFLRANDLSHVKEICLLHLSDNNGNAERFKREIQGLTGKPVYVAGERG